jgi:hypothetical protein
MFNESTIEDAALAWFADLDYVIELRLNFSLEPSVESATSASDRALEVEP